MMARMAPRLIALILVVITLAACSVPEPIMEAPPQPTPVAFAPIGDGMTVRLITQIIYYLSPDGLRLKPMLCDVTIMPGETILESLMERLLAGPDNAEFAPIFPEYVNMYFLSAEQSQGVATVNLTGAFASLSMEQQFIARMAIVNTLTELNDIRYVNLLIDGKESPLFWHTLSGGLSAATNPEPGENIMQPEPAPRRGLALPTGAMVRTEDTDSAYMQLRALVDRINASDSTGRHEQEVISRHVTLYFASEDGTTLMPEVREMEMGTADYIVPVVEAMIRGPSDTARFARTLPAGVELRLAYVDSWENVTHVVVDLREGADKMIQRSPIGADAAYASMVHTCLTFVPGAQAVRFQIEGVDYDIFAIDNTAPNGKEEEGTDAEEAQAPSYTRESFSIEVGRDITIYLPLADGRIRQVRKSVLQGEAGMPRNWLRTMLEETRSAAAASRAVLPFPDTLREEEILGLAIAGETMIVNLSKTAAEGFAGADREPERAWVYALVNTLCGIPGIKSVRFLVEGVPIETFAGNIWLREALIPNPGLVEK